MVITCSYTGFFRSVVTKKRRESAHARILEGILNGELRACVDSRRFFVTTDLKNPVNLFSCTFQGWCGLAKVGVAVDFSTLHKKYRYPSMSLRFQHREMETWTPRANMLVSMPNDTMCRVSEEVDAWSQGNQAREGSYIGLAYKAEG